MADKFREKLGYLSDEIEESQSLLRSNSPHIRADSKNGSRSPRRVSRSPHPYPAVDSQQPSNSLSHSSRPEIAAWPAPPPPNAINMKPVAKTNPVRPTTSATSPVTFEDASNLSEDSNKLLSMLKVAAASSAGRGRESELRRKIQNLEETVADYERQKYSVMGSFTEYRERVVERERKLEAEYSGKIIALSEEVLGAKKDFEARMKSFQALQERFEKEKQQALEKMRQEHQKEIQVLEQRFSASQLINLEQKYIIEIQRLEEERKSLRAEKERLGETFEMKLRRAQSLYETELSAAKMLYQKELEALRDHEEALKEELAARQEEFHDRLQELELQAKQSKDEMNGCRQDVVVLEKKLKAKEDEIASISKDLATAAAEAQKSLHYLDTLSNSHDELKEEYKEQAWEIKHKLDLLKSAENTKSRLEDMIRDLQMEVKALKAKVEFLEKERNNLMSQTDSQGSLHNSQVRALEAVLQTLTEEKNSAREYYENLLAMERGQAESREFSMKKEYSQRLNEIEEQYNCLREHLEGNDAFGPDSMKLWEEIATLRSEKRNLEEEVTTMRNQLQTVEQINDAPDSKISLDYVVELLKAIESVKAKISKGNSSKSSVSSKSKENSVDADTQRILDVDVTLLKDQLREELDGNAGSRGPELNRILSRLHELESSLDDIIVEKNGALQRVEDLKVENARLVAEVHGPGKDESSENLIISQLKENIDAQAAQITEQSRLIEEKTAEIDAYKARLEANDKTNADFENERNASQAEIKTLRDELNELTEMKERVETELQSRKAELAKISKKTEDYVRQRDQKQALIYERKLESLKEEHEKEMQALRESEAQLRQDLEAALAANETHPEEDEIKPDLAEDGVQTDDVPDISDNKKEVEDLLKLVEELRAEVTARDDAMRKAIKVDTESEDLELDCEHVTVEEKKSPRAQSVTVMGSTSSSEPPVTCHKNMFQTLVSQMTDKKERRESKTDAADAKKAAKKKEREQKELIKKNAATSLTTRAKSPSLLTRLRDRSPSKTKFLSPEPTSPSPTSSKNLLSPIDAERPAEERETSRRASPSRPLFARKTKEGSEPMDKSEKRPAWKF
uniref:FAM184 domain-containing protein n=1 Tax=Panagrellus redivivus TaxID=6233 RepID=A0A7E4VW30_PANRE